jgi:hypothetical protein
VLLKLRAPVLELAFVPPIAKASEGFLAPSATDLAQAVLHCLATLSEMTAASAAVPASNADKGLFALGGGGMVDPSELDESAVLRLHWERLSPTELDQTLALLSRPTGSPTPLTPSLAEKMRRLPLYETLAGGARVALLPVAAGAAAVAMGAVAAAAAANGAGGGGGGGVGGGGDGGDGGGGGGPMSPSGFYTLEAQSGLLEAGWLPTTTKARFLLPKPSLADLYRDLGVPALAEVRAT